MNNLSRYLLTLGLGFLGGVGTAAAEDEKNPDYLRHGIIGMGPAVVALQLTLQKSEVVEAQKSKGTAAGQ